MVQVFSTHRLRPGDPMPEFTLPDAEGRAVSFHDRGSLPALVVFACNHCPYVVHLARAVGDLAREYGGRLAVFAINSNDIEAYPADAPEAMVPFARSHGWTFPYLFDETQEVARAYGAACTPDFFLGDATGRLFYCGQFDDTRPAKYTGTQVAPDGASLRAAIDRLLTGREPPATVLPSTGCNIKWKPGNEPDWFPGPKS